MKKSGLILIIGLMMNQLGAQTIAFPEAEGFGKYTTGGRGGRVIEVTNLSDLNRNGTPAAGSFRAALNTSGSDPITIIFKVSGIIELASELKSSRSNMTIAGQSAPGDGICIKNESVKLSGSNLIVRYIRFRPGDELKGQASGLNIENAKNIIVDHCSMSWAIEECMGFYDNKYTTVQWCILSEGLYNSYHSKGPRGYGSQWGGQYASYHHNLIAHQRSRSPRINGSRAHDTLAVVDFRNNVVFNWGSSGAVYGGEEEIPGGKSETNFINNYYIPGPATPTSRYFAAPSYVTDGNSAYGYGAWYFEGNVMEGYTDITADNWKGVDVGKVGSVDNVKSNVAFEVSEITTHTALQAKSQVLTKAGATLPKRDAVDLRIVMEINGQSTIFQSGIIDSQTQVGGWPTYNSLEPQEDTDGDGMPDEYETENGFNANDANDGKTILSSGYSNLEVYLNSITGVHGKTDVEPEVLNIEDLKISIFPNPTADIFDVKSPVIIQECSVFDLNGQLVAMRLQQGKDFSVDLSTQPKGVYLLKIKTLTGAIATHKIVKQ